MKHMLDVRMRRGRRHISGLSLIEVLIAVLIVTVGLLGLAGLQGFSLRNNTSAYFRSQANALAYDILDSMRANRVNAAKGDYVVAVSADSSSIASRAASDISFWLDNLRHYLPAGDGEISCDANAFCVVTVFWDDNRTLPLGQTCAGDNRLAVCQHLTVSTRL